MCQNCSHITLKETFYISKVRDFERFISSCQMRFFIENRNTQCQGHKKRDPPFQKQVCPPQPLQYYYKIEGVIAIDKISKYSPNKKLVAKVMRRDVSPVNYISPVSSGFSKLCGCVVTIDAHKMMCQGLKRAKPCHHIVPGVQIWEGGSL